jgi:error-prone DNA polymerase
VIDAKNHGVEFLPVDVNHSEWDNILEHKTEKYWTVRLGFRQVKGIRSEDASILVTARKTKFISILELKQAGLSDAMLERLAEADAFQSMDQDRRKALWNATTKDDQINSLFSTSNSNSSSEDEVELPEMALSEQVVHDYAATSLSLKAHPVSFVRQDLQQLRSISAIELQGLKIGEIIKIAGLILVRQRPSTASGICFITIEDETGNANLVAYPQLFDKYRKEIIQSRLLMVEGKVQREGEVIHVIVTRCFNLSRLLQKLIPSDDKSISTLARSDETTSPGLDPRDKASKSQSSIFHDGRNFR